jgi:hypothetical protein
VLEHIFKPAIDEAAKPGESDVRFVVSGPIREPLGEPVAGRDCRR